LVDIIACLRKSDRLKENGCFIHDPSSHVCVNSYNGCDISLHKGDVDIFQRAKAGITASIICLMARAGVHFNDLKQICVCGAFGQYLEIANAQSIGLLPNVSPEHIKLCGNMALTGCEILLYSDNPNKELTSLKKKNRLVNMAGDPEFETHFIRNLYLRPLESG